MRATAVESVQVGIPEAKQRDNVRKLETGLQVISKVSPMISTEKKMIWWRSAAHPAFKYFRGCLLSFRAGVRRINPRAIMRPKAGP